MKKILLPTMLILTTIFISGCTCIGTHIAKVEGGKKTTTGFFSFSAIDNGYPMIPYYSKFEVAE